RIPRRDDRRQAARPRRRPRGHRDCDHPASQAPGRPRRSSPPRPAGTPRVRGDRGTPVVPRRPQPVTAPDPAGGRCRDPGDDPAAGRPRRTRRCPRLRPGHRRPGPSRTALRPEGERDMSPQTEHSPWRWGYGTNGLADLRLDDALALLADLGYDGVGLTLDHMHLDPLAPDLAARTRRVAHRLQELGLGVTVETGARYVLDPRRKHGPSLLDSDPEDRARRTDLL